MRSPIKASSAQIHRWGGLIVPLEIASSPGELQAKVRDAGTEAKARRSGAAVDGRAPARRGGGVKAGALHSRLRRSATNIKDTGVRNIQ